MKKNKKSWFKGLVVAGVFAISVLNLSIDFQKNVNGYIDLSKLSITSSKILAQESLGSSCNEGDKAKCYQGIENPDNFYCWVSVYDSNCQ